MVDGMIKQRIQDCISGSGYLERYGSHPGTLPLIGPVVLGAVAGSKRGWMGSVLGAVTMLVLFGGVWLIGAHDRGKEHRLQNRG